MPNVREWDRHEPGMRAWSWWEAPCSVAFISAVTRSLVSVCLHLYTLTAVCWFPSLSWPFSVVPSHPLIHKPHTSIYLHTTTLTHACAWILHLIEELLSSFLFFIYFRMDGDRFCSFCFLRLFPSLLSSWSLTCFTTPSSIYFQMFTFPQPTRHPSFTPLVPFFSPGLVTLPKAFWPLIAVVLVNGTFSTCNLFFFFFLSRSLIVVLARFHEWNQNQYQNLLLPLGGVSEERFDN